MSKIAYDSNENNNKNVNTNNDSSNNNENSDNMPSRLISCTLHVLCYQKHNFFFVDLQCKSIRRPKE